MLNRSFTHILLLSTKWPVISIRGMFSTVGLGTQMKAGMSKFVRLSQKGMNSSWLLKMCQE
jgi:hypothetical protein